MPNIRGHHLICLHFFNGEGYNPEFITNLRDVLRKAGGESVRISAGADDICRKCPHLKIDECRFSEDSEEEIRRMDAKAVGLLGLSEGGEAGWAAIRERIPGIFGAWYDSCCDICGWRGACEKDPLYRKLREDNSH